MPLPSPSTTQTPTPSRTSSPKSGTVVFDYALQLAEGIRCRILMLLEHHELAVSELCSVLRLPQSTVSRHLKVLVDGGWLAARRDGTSQLYHLEAPPDAAADGLWQLFRDQLLELEETAQDFRRLDEVLRARRSRSQEFFAQSAPEWDRLRDELFGRRLDAWALVGLLDPHWQIGDLGCGTGRFAATLAPYVAQVVAVDGSQAMLEAAATRLASFSNIRLLQGELEALPLPDASLDVAALVLALHHAADPAKVLAESHRVLKPVGRLLLVDLRPHRQEEYRQQMGHLWLGFAEDALKDWLVAATFQEIHIVPLPADPDAQGPRLFAAGARKAGTNPTQPRSTQGETR